jgi:uncharacterized phage-like protein YoqJ
MTLMVTGHRKIVPQYWTGNPYPDDNLEVQEHHNKILVEIQHYMIRYMSVGFGHEFVTGMAIGADQIFAKAAIGLKESGFSLKIIAAIPFVGQERKWPKQSQKQYNDILKQCESYIVSPGGYGIHKMQVRNKWMVDRSQHVLAIWDGIESGGTWNCIKYAKSLGKFIIVLRPDTLNFYILK